MQLYDRDRDHLKILGIVYYVNAGTIAFCALFGLLYAGIGLFMLAGGLPGPAHGKGLEEAKMVGMMFAIFGGAAALFCLTLGLLNFLAGRWLRSEKHRIFCFVVGCLNLMSLPYGTLLGIFTILVLNRPRVKAIFAGAPDVDAATEDSGTLAGSGAETKF